MPTDHRAVLASVKRFDQLIAYLRDELGWPIDHTSFNDVEDLFYDFTPEELGIDVKNTAKIQEIRRLRPLSTQQPWGIFFVKFEPKRLPVVALRRILSQVTLKKRASANSDERAAWSVDDLLFISNYGEGEERKITFAHFAQRETKKDLPTLKVLGWDNLDTALHLDHVADLLTERLTWPDDEEDTEEWRRQWGSAFTLGHREVITTSKTLSVELARLARDIRARINTVLAIETEDGPVTKLMTAFRQALVHDLDEDGFADMYAQTIAYGLLSARVSSPSGGSADDFAAAMPVTNPFLKELMETFLDVGGRKNRADQGTGLDFDELGVSEVVELLDAANMEAVVLDFGDRNPQEDPVIHFYELFLKEYDKKKKMERGVFYTPRSIVSFIVRSVDELLRTEFGLEDGLADTTTWGEMAERFDDIKIPEGATPDQGFVQILDPATGTGTFLVEVIDYVYSTMKKKWEKEGRGPLHADVDRKWNEYVPKFLLPRLHGYELMMAPYAIAHMKIGLKLYETGYRFNSDERARVYLTNALEPAQDFSGTLAFAIPALAHEAEAVNKIKKNQRFTVVIGNPPYSVYSANKTRYIDSLMHLYKQIAGLPISEVRIAPLMDDYCKFIRFSDSLISMTGYGVVGMITNHSYLTGPVFRGMRYNIMSRYSVDILDLHGNYFRGDPSSGDTNVFEIKPGVCIAMLTRTHGNSYQNSVRYDEMRGTGEFKLKVLPNYRRHSGSEFNSVAPNYHFTPQSCENEEYLSFHGINEIFALGTLGMMTGKDHFMIAPTAGIMKHRIGELLDSEVSSGELREKYNLSDSRDWRLSRAREIKFDESRLSEVCYRPFDRQFTYFDKKALASPQSSVNNPLLEKGNLAICVPRQLATLPFRHALVSDCVTEMSFISNRTKEANRVFPLFSIKQPEDANLFDHGKPLNLKAGFLSHVNKALGLQTSALQGCPTAESVFRYIYAILYSREYRERYAEFLKVDYPRIPLVCDIDLLCVLAELGDSLVSLHMMKSPKLNHHITNLVGSGEFYVEKVDYSDKTVWIDMAKSRGFRGVPEEVWIFHIGSYQVCEKWLKDRQAKGGKNPRPGRVLTEEDIDHYQKIVVALNETIRIMAEIDEVIKEHGGWPDAFQKPGVEYQELEDREADDLEKAAEKSEEFS